MAKETKSNHKYPKGSPSIRRKGNALFLYIMGEAFVVGIPSVLQLIKGKGSPFHYFNVPPRAQEKGITLDDQLRKVCYIGHNRYKGYSTLSGANEAKKTTPTEDKPDE